MTYAADTKVSTDRSRSEIERILSRYGATGFAYGWEPDRAMVGFQLHNRTVQFVIPMPDPASKEFLYSGHKPPRRLTALQSKAAYEQVVRQRWRAMALIIKAKLEAVATGVVSFDQEFLAQLVLPNGQSVGDYVVPRVAEAYETGQTPALLPSFDQKAISQSPV